MPQYLRADAWRRAHARTIFWVVLPVLVVFLGVAPAPGAMVGGVHDFIDNGFSGGGVCAECHVPHGADATAGRLYPRPGDTTNWSTSPARLCQDCHKASGSSSLPTGGGWDAVSGVVPPDFPHSTAGAQYETCGKCHDHLRGFVVPNDDCCVCHTTSANGGLFNDATEANLEVDLRFNGICFVNDNVLMSQHQVRYVADGNLATSETSADNECKKCHGDGVKHPSDTAYLTDPDGIVYRNERAFNPVAPDYSKYERFCVACHDGVDGGAPEQFNGPVPVNQVAPSDRSNPGIQQTAAPWIVPAVPPKDVNDSAPYTNPNPSASNPYFAYFYYSNEASPVGNGHGLDTGIEGVMNVTCMAGGAADGCHAPHGTHNRFLIDEVLTTGADTAGEFVTGVCYSCHVEADLQDPNRAFLANNYFHGWSEDRPGLHIPNGVGMAQWREISESTGLFSMYIVNPFVDPNGAGTFPDSYTSAGILPFYAGAGAPIQGRVYNPTLGSHWIMCLTCHDPHGTSTTHDIHTGYEQDTGTENTEAMLRKFPITWDPVDPLCGECHSTSQ